MPVLINASNHPIPETVHFLWVTVLHVLLPVWCWMLPFIALLLLLIESGWSTRPIIPFIIMITIIGPLLLPWPFE